MKKLLTTLTLSLLAICTIAPAEEKVEVVLDGLHNPSGLAVQPNTGHLFVADSGAGKIVRVVDGKSEDVVTDFPQDVYGKGPKYHIGPLGLAFIDEDTLVVADGSQVDTKEVIRVYTVPKAGEAAIKADAAKATLGPLDAEGDLAAEGNYYGVVVTKTAIYATANGDDTKGWIVRAAINGDGSFGKLERYLATKEATGVDAPVAITVSDKGQLVVGQMGEISAPNDGLITFYDAKSKKMLLNLETGLHDETALVYSPKGHLYALDFAWAKPEDGGLYRLDAEGKGKEQTITPKKIVSLMKPAAMAFGDDGALYIAVFGDTQGDEVAAEEPKEDAAPADGEGEEASDDAEPKEDAPAEEAKKFTGQVIRLEPGL